MYSLPHLQVTPPSASPQTSPAARPQSECYSTAPFKSANTTKPASLHVSSFQGSALSVPSDGEPAGTIEHSRAPLPRRASTGQLIKTRAPAAHLSLINDCTLLGSDVSLMSPDTLFITQTPDHDGTPIPTSLLHMFSETSVPQRSQPQQQPQQIQPRCAPVPDSYWYSVPEPLFPGPPTAEPWPNSPVHHLEGTRGCLTPYPELWLPPSPFHSPEGMTTPPPVGGRGEGTATDWVFVGNWMEDSPPYSRYPNLWDENGDLL